MAKKSVGEKFSDWLSGYRSRPDDEYYNEEYYDQEESFFDDYADQEPSSSVEGEEEDEYVDIYDALGHDSDKDFLSSSSTPRKGFGSRKGRPAATRDRRGGRDREADEENNENGGPKIYSMDRGNGVKIKIVAPTRFDGTTKTIIDEIRSGSILVIKLEQVSRQDYIRFVDFLAGAVYIMGSNMQYVNERILIIAPKNVSLSGGEFREIYEVEPVASIY